MNPGAQQRADRIRAFRAELAELTAEGAIDLSPEQRANLEQHLDRTLNALAARFDIDTTEEQRQISWGMRIASTIAGLALCAAAVLYFHRIWGLLPIAGQVALLVAAPVVCIAAMEVAARRERTPYYTALLGILALAAAVLNLEALGGIFNLTPTPNALLVWAIFGFGIAYAYRLRLILAAGIFCGIGFASMRLLKLAGLPWQGVDSRVETLLATGAMAALAPRLIRHTRWEGFPWVYRMTGFFAMFAAILLGCFNGRATFLPFGSRRVEELYMLAGLAAASLVMRYGIRIREPGTVNLAAGAFAVYLYVRLHEWWWDLMPRYLFFLLVGLIALGLLILFQRLRRKTGAAA
jgi:uncharacterized membrane protein